MMSKYMDDLKEIQQQYFNLISSYEILENKVDFYSKTVALIDSCEAFWLSKKLQLFLIIEDITKDNKCFLLSGAIYLDVAENSHYTFGALGDINILSDPIIRMRGFFANGLDGINEYTRTYFCDVFSDILKIQKDFSNEFIFISIDVLYDSFLHENIKLIDKVYWDIISGMLGKEIRSLKELGKEFTTIEEIEKNMTKGKLNLLIFSDDNDVNLPLAKRIKLYFECSQLPMNLSFQNEIECFYFATFSQIQQSIEIIFKCLQFGFVPFIRNEVTIKYFMLIGGAFPTDSKLKEMVDFTIISYLYSVYVESENVYKQEFKIFHQKCKEQHFIETVYNKINSNEKDMYSMHVADVIKVIHDELFALLDK